MRRAALALLGTVAGLVALLSFKTHGTSVATVPAATTGLGETGATDPVTDPSAAPGSSGTSGTSGSSAPTAAAPSSAAAGATRTVTGDSEDTRWGPVQVRITVTHGTITSATAIDYPQNNGRDEEINSYAIPTLQQESVGKTKASQVDAVSGATYTSDGYLRSLQSALDKL